MRRSPVQWRWLRPWVLGIPAVLLAMVTSFVGLAWLGSSIPRNHGWSEPEQGIEIFVGTNGVHTEIAMPVATEVIDWRGRFALADIEASTRPYTHVAVSWGEERFFRETPTWGDLDPLVGLGALIGGDALFHVAWYVRPMPSEDFRPMRISHAQYAALSQAIESGLAPEEERQTYPGYSAHDAFYSASGTYHLGRTCNQWTSDTLAAGGIRTGWWTPFPGGVMKWVPDLPD